MLQCKWNDADLPLTLNDVLAGYYEAQRAMAKLVEIDPPCSWHLIIIISNTKCTADLALVPTNCVIVDSSNMKFYFGPFVAYFE